MNPKLVKVVAIVLAAIMVLGVVTAAVSAFAVSPAAGAAIVATGEGSGMKIAVVVGVLAVLAIGVTTLLPKFLKK